MNINFDENIPLEDQIDTWMMSYDTDVKKFGNYLFMKISEIKVDAYIAGESWNKE